MRQPRASFWVCAAMLALGAGSASALSRAEDPVLSGYRLFYDGEPLAAMRHFEALVSARPDDLPARFGRLFMEEHRIDIDPSLTAGFERDLDAFLDAADTRRSRTAQDTEALFYEAQAYLLRGEYRFDHNKGALGAIRDGARAKGYIETYLKQHPEHGDAYLAEGFYNYFIELAPTYFHFFRFFLFLPAGDRAAGLRELERAAHEGSLFGPLAQTLLVQIYGSFEGRPQEAIAMAERLTAAHPGNDEVAFTLAGFYAGPLMEDRPRAARLHEAIIARRERDATPDGATSRANAILGLATDEFEDWRCAEAVATLTRYIDAPPPEPAWLLPTLLLRRANYLAVMNDDRYRADLQRILDRPEFQTWHVQAQNLMAGLDARRVSGESATTAAMIPANRFLAEGRWDDARQAYQALQVAHPASPALRYRLALVDFSQGLTDRALPVFQALAAADKTIPDNVKAQAWLYIGRTYDLAGRREDAKKAYTKVVDDYEKQARPAENARMGLLSPYRRPDRWGLPAKAPSVDDDTTPGPIGA